MQKIAGKILVAKSVGTALLDLVFGDPHWQPVGNDQWGSRWRYNQKNTKGTIEFDWRNTALWQITYAVKIMGPS